MLMFFLGGYLVPAAYHALGIAFSEAEAEDSPTFFEIIVSAIIGGLLWPVNPHKYEPH